ncbi:MAG: hypothetical protein ACI94Y_001380 [Maribacter sp.]|jgi:hypothetical protein
MKNFFTTILSFFILFSTGVIVDAQVGCTDGSFAEVVTLDLAGKKSAGPIGSSGNDKGTLCLGSAIEKDVVGLEWEDISVNPVGQSWCSEARIDFNNGEVFLAPAKDENNVGPCMNNYASGFITDLNGQGLVFTTDALGCINWEAYETDDDNSAAGLDQQFNGGLVKFYACPLGEILPVELIYFDAIKDESTAVLKWETASEENNLGFNIEHSTNGEDFRPIGWVEGAGTTVEVQQYRFVDEDPIRGLNYYRLVQTDIDGTITRSDVEVLTFESKFHASVFPNPTRLRKETTLRLFIETKQNVIVRVYNMIGQLALEVSYDLNQGDNEVILPHGNMDSGQYTISVTYDERIIKDMRLHILE